jgi:hypothetical protein
MEDGAGLVRSTRSDALVNAVTGAPPPSKSSESRSICAKARGLVSPSREPWDGQMKDELGWRSARFRSHIGGPRAHSKISEPLLTPVHGVGRPVGGSCDLLREDVRGRLIDRLLVHKAKAL